MDIFKEMRDAAMWHIAFNWYKYVLGALLLITVLYVAFK